MTRLIETHAEHTTFNASLAAKAVNELRRERGAAEIPHASLVRYLAKKEPVSKGTIRKLAAASESRLPKALQG